MSWFILPLTAPSPRSNVSVPCHIGYRIISKSRRFVEKCCNTSSHCYRAVPQTPTILSRYQNSFLEIMYDDKLYNTTSTGLAFYRLLREEENVIILVPNVGKVTERSCCSIITWRNFLDGFSVDDITTPLFLSSLNCEGAYTSILKLTELDWMSAN